MIVMENVSVAALLATVLAGAPLLLWARTLTFAIISVRSFRATEGLMELNEQPLNEDGEPIQIRCRYRYQVHGDGYSGNRFYFGSKNTTDKAYLKMYPQGSKVLVYFNPESPEQSTLQLGVKRQLLYWGLCFAFIAPLIWLFALGALVLPWGLGDGPSGLL